jgi:hypothetical protein
MAINHEGHEGARRESIVVRYYRRKNILRKMYFHQIIPTFIFENSR